MRILGHDIELTIRRASKKEASQIPTHVSGSSIPFLASRNNALLLSAVYRCVNVISDSVAALPLEAYQIDDANFRRPFKEHPAYRLLNLEPNENMTRFVFIKTMVVSSLLKGNAYAYIERDSHGNPVQLIYIPSDLVSIVWIVDHNGIQRKRYMVSGFKQYVEPRDMIHILNFSDDGIIGVSTLTHAAQTIGIATDSETHASGFFRSGANAAGILTIEHTRLTKEQKEQNYREWETRTNPITGNPNGIVILEGNQRYQPITINPKDSQLLESRQFNVVDICRFFSVSPVKVFDLTKSNYNTVEALNLDYLTDTLTPMLTKIEQEITRKLFLPSEDGHVVAEFNTSALLRADKKSQTEYMQGLFSIGAVTPNEVRREINLPKLPDGDQAFVQVNVQPIYKALALDDKSTNNDNGTEKQGNKEHDASGQE